MTVLLVVLLAGVLLATLGARKKVAGPAPGRSRRAAKRGAWGPYWLLGAVLLGLVMMRFGVNWIVVAAGMAAALLRSLLPLLRFLPMLESLRRGRSNAADADAGRSSWSGADGGAGSHRDSASGSSAGGGRRAARMTRHEALQVFGLDESATPEDVQREYRRLMRKIHPDLGGSSYLAAKINEARDVLS